MAFERQGDLVSPHAAAIVGHFDQIEAALPQPHGDLCCPRINGILDQFLERGCRTLDHFAGGDAVDETLRQAANMGHVHCLAAKRREFETGSVDKPVKRHNFLAFRPSLR